MHHARAVILENNLAKLDFSFGRYRAQGGVSLLLSFQSFVVS